MEMVEADFNKSYDTDLEYLVHRGVLAHARRQVQRKQELQQERDYPLELRPDIPSLGCPTAELVSYLFVHGEAIYQIEPFLATVMLTSARHLMADLDVNDVIVEIGRRRYEEHQRRLDGDDETTG
jgi:hypothetical protein